MALDVIMVDNTSITSMAWSRMFENCSSVSSANLFIVEYTFPYSLENKCANLVAREDAPTWVAGAVEARFKSPLHVKGTSKPFAGKSMAIEGRQQFFEVPLKLLPAVGG